jgi:hypothetical protein
MMQEAASHGKPTAADNTDLLLNLAISTMDPIYCKGCGVFLLRVMQ